MTNSTQNCKSFLPPIKNKNIIAIELGELQLMKILKRQFKLDKLLNLPFDSKGLIIQGNNTEGVKMLGSTTIPTGSFKTYICKRDLTINVPINLKDLGVKCERIEIFEEDSWRANAKFEFKDGATYRVSSHTLSDKRDIVRLKSFNNYFYAKRTLNEYGRKIDVLVKNGIASFRTGNLRFKYVLRDEDGELYCKFMVDNLKPLNNFLDLSLKGSSFKFSNEVKNYLFSIETEDHKTDIVLKR